MKFNNICIAYNLHKEKNIYLSERIKGILEKNFLETIMFPLSHIKPYKLSPEVLKEIDLVIVLGGDGTLLSAARYFCNYPVFMLGINTGHLGFLTEATIPQEDELESFLVSILEGNYQVDIRSMLQAEIIRNENNKGFENNLIALNEVVITRSSRSSVINLDLEIDGSPVANYMADGLIISTPTGSTAYSLGAGGSVLSPNIEAFQIVPICAHSLTSRPLVVSDTSELKITVYARNLKQSLISLQGDGQDNFLIESGEQVVITKSPHKTMLIHSNDKRNNFYNVLNKKLLWGMQNR